MTWLDLDGHIEGVKIKGKAYFAEFDRLIALAQSNSDYQRRWERANLGPVTGAQSRKPESGVASQGLRLHSRSQ